MRAELGQTIVPENVGGAGGCIGLGRRPRRRPTATRSPSSNWSAHGRQRRDLSPALRPQDRFRADRAAGAGAADGGRAARRSRPTISRASSPGSRPIPTRPRPAPQAPAARRTSAACCSSSMTGTSRSSCPIAAYRWRCRIWSPGQIDIIFSDPTTATPQVRGGTIKAYAVAQPTRLAGAAGPADLRRSRPARLLCRNLERAVRAEGHAEGHHRQAQRGGGRGAGRSGGARAARRVGQEIPPREQQTPEALGALHKADIEKWWPIIKAANIKPE